MFNKFNKKSFIGISISDYSVKVLELNEDSSEVLGYGKNKFEDGVVEHGIIKDKDKLAEAINNLFENTGIKSSSDDEKKIRVNLNIPEIRTFIHIFDLPKDIIDKNLKDAVLEEANRRVPAKSDELYWDFIEINGGEFRTVFYYAVFREAVESYLDVMNMAGLDVAVLDIESVSLARAILFEKNNQSSLIVDIGDEDTTINVFDENNIPRMSVDCSIAGSDITNDISSKLEIDYVEAEKIKIENGLSEQSSNVEALSIIKDDIKKIATEIKKTINYYENNYSSKIEQVFLTGGSSLLPELDEYLEGLVGKKIKIGDSLNGIDNRDSFDYKKVSAHFASTLGVVLRREGNLLNGVNFIKQVQEEEEKKRIGEKRLKYKTDLKDSLSNVKESKLFAVFVLIICFSFLVFTVYTYFYKPMVNPSPIQNSISVVSTVDIAEEIEENTEEVVEYEENEEEVTNQEEPNSNSEEVEELEDGVENEETIKGEEEVYVVISDTPTGTLNVRSGPGVEYLLLDEIYPGEDYLLLDEEDGWYKILLVEGVDTWIVSDYAIKK